MLGHVLQGVEPIYDRFDYLEQKRGLLEAWGRKLEEIIAGKDESSKVVELVEHRT